MKKGASWTYDTPSNLVFVVDIQKVVSIPRRA